MLGVSTERLTPRGELGPRARDDRPLARVEALPQERDRPRDLLVLSFVGEGVAAECCAVTRDSNWSIPNGCWLRQ
jgi:hypothetical protein